MTKKLTKAQQAEAREAALHAALAWPDCSRPEPLSGDVLKERAAHLGYGDADAIRLWTYNAYSMRVTHGCVSRVSHSPEGARASSQARGGPWFDTQEDACRALRWAVTRRLAGELLTLNERISQELSPRSPA